MSYSSDISSLAAEALLKQAQTVMALLQHKDEIIADQSQAITQLQAQIDALEKRLYGEVQPPAFAREQSETRFPSRQPLPS